MEWYRKLKTFDMDILRNRHHGRGRTRVPPVTGPGHLFSTVKMAKLLVERGHPPTHHPPDHEAAARCLSLTFTTERRQIADSMAMPPLISIISLGSVPFPTPTPARSTAYTPKATNTVHSPSPTQVPTHLSPPGCPMLSWADAPSPEAAG